MLKKRLIGAITVKNGIAVQSFGYKKYLPIGSPKVIVENLDRWGVDEIFIQVIDRSRKNLGPDIDLIKKISSSGILTPIMYAGGIHNEDQAAEVIRAGAERVCIDALLHSNLSNVKKIAMRLGSQAIVGCLPVLIDKNGKVFWHNYLTNEKRTLDENLINVINDGLISELLLIDSKNEGYYESFDFRILSLTKKLDIPLILFGGLNSKKILNEALNIPKVEAAAIGNSLNYKEHSVQRLKNLLSSLPIRPAYYHDRSIFKHYD